ncbi:MAG: hypothetical protein QNJ26_01965 [Desulfobacterales bacterium]|nr:hypothetical protein [Desulfobacterales bacterium]
MMRQVCNHQGHVVIPLRAILFFAAMLLFIFTVIYRMVKSDSVSTAMATLIESLLIVAFFIFLGILIAYLLYFIQDRFRHGAKSDPVYGIFDTPTSDNKSASKPNGAEAGTDSDENAESGLNS